MKNIIVTFLVFVECIIADVSRVASVFLGAATSLLKGFIDVPHRTHDPTSLAPWENIFLNYFVKFFPELTFFFILKVQLV